MPRFYRNYTNFTKNTSIPDLFVAGQKFIKWDEESGIGIPVTLKIDKYGFYLYWLDANNDVDCIDIATIRDVRTGRYAKTPKDPKLKQFVTFGTQDTLEEKTVSVCCGSDFVNVLFTNFCCAEKQVAATLSDLLLSICFNIAQLNASTITFLLKAYVRLSLNADKNDTVPIKNVIKIFAQNKDDKKRIEKALDISGLPCGKTENVSLDKFQFEDFYNLYKNLTQRSEVETFFDELVNTNKRQLMSTSQFMEFLNKIQRDSRLNEILYPYVNSTRAKEIIIQYEPNKYNAQRGLLSFDGFLSYLMSDDNNIMAKSTLDLSNLMDYPLSHYFINSSHNTYLMGHQLTGKSSVEVYRQCLLAGCRCVELDFWNGQKDEPVIVHGFTFVPDISAKEVLEAIAECAFKTSDYPVILSFENHCNSRQQAKIANYCREIFGDKLLDHPLESHKLESGLALPSPNLLRNKIIIKNKKKHHHHHHYHTHQQFSTTGNNGEKKLLEVFSGQSTDDCMQRSRPYSNRQGSKESSASETDDSASDDEIELNDAYENDSGCLTVDTHVNLNANINHKISEAKETEAGAEISALVNYIQPVHFISFDIAEKRNRFYEMSSFDEKQATSLLKEYPTEFVNYNKCQLSRVYPAGTRFDSSNFMPQIFWNAGCQLVALNFQTLDLAMQLNSGVFEYNFRTGYIPKPEFMRRKDRCLDPFAESTVDGIIAGTVSITVLSGQFLSDKRISTYVEVEMYGLPADTVRKKFRTKIVQNNAINPVYNEEPFVFKKIVLPELAVIRIAAFEESGKMIGHRILPVVGLCPGYRHLHLRTELGQPLPLSTLFLLVVVKDYVPDTFLDFAEALANPIKYQSELEKRSVQLSVLTDDLDCSLTDKDGTEKSSSVESNVPAESTSSVDVIHKTDPEVTMVPQKLSPTNTFTPMAPCGSNSVTSGGGGGGGGSTQMLNDQSSFSKSVDLGDEVLVESVDKIFDNKLIKDKRLELEKKLDLLRKRQEKEKLRLISQKSNECSSTKEKRLKFNVGNRFVKRLSSKHIFFGSVDQSTDTNSPSTSNDTQATTEDDTSNCSEKLLNLTREHINQEKELREKYCEAIFSLAEKIMQNTHSNQLKELKNQLERETSDIMRRLQEIRKVDIKALSKIHRDRDELVRVKREVASAVVEKGVNERVKLTQLYENKRDEILLQQEIVSNSLNDQKQKTKLALEKEFEIRVARLDLRLSND